MAIIKAVNRNGYFLTFRFSNSCLNQNDLQHFLSFFTFLLLYIKYLVLRDVVSCCCLHKLHDLRVPLSRTRLPCSRLQVQPTAKPSTKPQGTHRGTTRTCHREGAHSPAVPSLTPLGLTEVARAPSPPPLGLAEPAGHPHDTLPLRRSPTVGWSSPVLAANRHLLVPQASGTCKFPHISAQTFHPPNTPAQTWGLLLAGQFSVEFSGKYQ